MKLIKLNKLVYLIIIFISLFLLRDLFKPGFYTSHDGHHQLIRMAVFDQGLKDGQFPVRWTGSALDGYGYPLFVFTYRLPFIIGEFFRVLFSFSYMNVIKAVFLVSFVLSGISMYWVLRDILKEELPAFFGSMVYLIAPYRFSNIFVRASLGEATAFIFWPIIFWAIYKLDKKTKVAILAGSLALSLALISHAMVFFIFLPFIVLFYGFQLFHSKKKLLFIKAAVLQLVFFLLLSSYYLIPAMLEKSQTVFNSVFSNHIESHFPSLKQLIYSPWGYGFSMPGLEDGMSFQVGLGQWLVAALGAAFIVYIFLKKKKQLTLLGFSLFGFSVSIFLMLQVSAWFWRKLGVFMELDFPWRLLSVSVFFAAFAAGIVSKYLDKNISKVFFIVAMIILLYGNRNHLKINQSFVYDDAQLVNSVDTSNSYNDYMPVGLSGVELGEADPFIQVKEGEGNFNLLEKKSNLAHIKATVETQKAEVLLKMAYFPGWEVDVNGERKKVESDQGKIKLNLTFGENDIKVYLKESNLRKRADILSLVGMIGIIIFAIYPKFNFFGLSKSDKKLHHS